jgi:hypothetical protein
MRAATLLSTRHVPEHVTRGGGDSSGHVVGNASSSTASSGFVSRSALASPLQRTVPAPSSAAAAAARRHKPEHNHDSSAHRAVTTTTTVPPTLSTSLATLSLGKSSSASLRPPLTPILTFPQMTDCAQPRRGGAARAVSPQSPGIALTPRRRHVTFADAKAATPTPAPRARVHPLFRAPGAAAEYDAKCATELVNRFSDAWRPCRVNVHPSRGVRVLPIDATPAAAATALNVPFAAVRRCALHPAAHMCVVGVERRDGGSTVYLDLRCATDLEAVVDRVQRGIVAAQGPAAFAGSVAAVCPRAGPPPPIVIDLAASPSWSVDPISEEPVEC